MDSLPIVILLAVVTLGGAVVFGIVNKRKTEQRMRDDTVEKSTLASDKASDGTPPDV